MVFYNFATLKSVQWGEWRLSKPLKLDNNQKKQYEKLN